MANPFQLILCLLCFSLLISCKPREAEDEDLVPKDELLAQVFTSKLFASDLQSLYPKNATKADSAQITLSYVERWVRDKLMIHEAEENIPKDLDIDKLVEDYRSSIVRHNYEKQLINEMLDTLVTEQQLTEYYKKNKDQYQLETDIVRCLLVKAPEQDIDVDRLSKLWYATEEVEKENLFRYCEQNAEVYLLNDSTWYELEQIASILPRTVLNASNISSKKRLNFKWSDVRYLSRIEEHFKKGETAPLSYIKDRVKRVLLHQREIKLLDELKETLYDKELNGSNVKIYIK